MRPHRCRYTWPDMDGCALPDGHYGDHRVFGPRCMVLGPQGLPCRKEAHHRDPHEVLSRWDNDLSEAYYAYFEEETTGRDT